MSPRETPDETPEAGKPARPYLQPLALAIVCLILISLLLGMRLIDLNALDKTLLGNMEKRSLDIVRNVQQLAELYYQRLTSAVQDDSNAEIGSQITEESFSLQEALILDLVDVAQDIDYRVETGGLGNKQLASIALKEGLWLIAVLDKDGVPILQSRPVPDNFLRLAGPVARGREEVTINFFDRSGSPQETGFIGIRRKFGQGVIILGLDAMAIEHWRFTVAIKEAVNDAGQVPDTDFFVVLDHDGRVLGAVGESPEERANEPLPKDLFHGKVKFASRKIDFEGKKLLQIIAPFNLREGFKGAVQLGLSMDQTDQILKKNRENILVSTIFMVIIAFLAMWFLYKNQNRHLARMQEMERRIQQANRLSAMGRLAAGVAHEIRNPLNAISMATQRLRNDNLDQLTPVIRDEIRRLNQIVEEFLSLSRSQKLKFSLHDLTELLMHIVLLIEEEAESRGIKINLNGKDMACVIPMDYDKLKQAFFNIVKNAMESIPEQGVIDIGIVSSEKEWVSVKITDTGSGLRPEEIKRIFDFDYTTKDKGLGLGLPLAHEIIRGHGGEIHASSRPGKGTVFEIRLPLYEK